MRIIIILLLVAIIVSLASGFRHLARGDDSGKLARALTWRVGLSVALLGALVLAAMMGWVEPGAL
ncbi:MAG: twin transmembrane helix small protein [Pseudomonadota bacterium]